MSQSPKKFRIGDVLLQKGVITDQQLSRALDELKKFKPDLVAVSAGFDAYARDPLAQETLEVEDFYWLGQSIRKLGVCTFSVLEGGYSSDLPELIFAYLKGLGGK